MRLIVAIAVVAFSLGAQAQVSVIKGTTTSEIQYLSEPQPFDMSKAKFILVTAQRVPCGECLFTYAVACGLQTAGCGQAYKTVYDYQPYASIEDALNQLNAGYVTFVGLYSIQGGKRFGQDSDRNRETRAVDNNETAVRIGQKIVVDRFRERRYSHPRD